MLLGAERLDDGRFACEFRSCESFASWAFGSKDSGATGASAGSRRESEETPKRFARASHELCSMDLSRGSFTGGSLACGSLACGSLARCAGGRDSTDREAGDWGFESAGATGSEISPVSNDADDAFGSEDAGESESPPPKLSWTTSVGGLGFLGDDAVDRPRAARGLSSGFGSEFGPGKLPGLPRVSGVLRVSSGTSVGRLEACDLAGAIAAVGSLGASVFGVFFERGARFGVPS